MPFSIKCSLLPSSFRCKIDKKKKSFQQQQLSFQRCNLRFDRFFFECSSAFLATLLRRIASRKRPTLCCFLRSFAFTIFLTLSLLSPYLTCSELIDSENQKEFFFLSSCCPCFIPKKVYCVFPAGILLLTWLSKKGELSWEKTLKKCVGIVYSYLIWFHYFIFQLSVSSSHTSLSLFTLPLYTL